MKALTPAMLAYLAGDACVLATCWKVTRADSTVMGFTDWTEDVSGPDDVTYKAATGYTRSAIETRSDLSVPNLEVVGVLDSAGITDSDIRAGKYDFAEVRIFMQVPTDTNATTYGIIKLRRGWTGEITLTEGQHTTELRGLAQALAQQIIELYTIDCQADFGDARCKFDLSTVTDTGVVIGVSIPRRMFAVSNPTARATDYYKFGVLTWVTGDNAGVSAEIKAWDASSFTLYLPSGADIHVGDDFSVHPGCDMTLTGPLGCSFHSNVVNFRGFPYIPGIDAMVRTPNAS